MHNKTSRKNSEIPITMVKSPSITSKSPLRKLNFNVETQVHSNNVIVEINKVSEKELTKFTSTKNENEAKEPVNKNPGHASNFYQLKSSPIQMFNSFSPSSPQYVTQTIGQRYGVEYANSEGKSAIKQICCNCKKSHCLKLYCECFLKKVFCKGCNCANCLNTEENKAQRDLAVQTTLDRNPIAFDPKFSIDNPEVLLDKILLILDWAKY
jgi:hypothetical protein